ncbi:hypothetical protein HHX47_DHR7000774, partial [Lentinula edodes]
SLTVPSWLRVKDQALSLFFSKVVTEAKEADLTLQPFATALYTGLQERAVSKTWTIFLKESWTTTTFTEQQWLFICSSIWEQKSTRWVKSLLALLISLYALLLKEVDGKEVNND